MGLRSQYSRASSVTPRSDKSGGSHQYKLQVLQICFIQGDKYQVTIIKS